MNKLTKALTEKYFATDILGQKFVDMHTILKHPDRNGNGDDIFNGNVPKAPARLADKNVVDTTAKPVIPPPDDDYGAEPDEAMKENTVNENEAIHAWHPHVVKERENVAAALETHLHHDYSDQHVGYTSQGVDKIREGLGKLGYNHEPLGQGMHDFVKRGEKGVVHSVNVKTGFGNANHVQMNHTRPTSEDVEMVTIDFSNGDTLDIPIDVSNSIQEVFDSLSNDNKEIFQHLLFESEDTFEQALDFVESQMITELSKKTLGSYIKKATSDAAVSHGNRIGAENSQDKVNSFLNSNSISRKEKDSVRNILEPNIRASVNSSIAKTAKRIKGIDKAVNRLTKEDAESVNELSVNTLTSYIGKAVRDEPKHHPSSYKHFDHKLKRANGVELAAKKLAGRVWRDNDHKDKK